jgi:Putative adhesin
MSRPFAAAFAVVLICASLAAQSQVIQPAKAESTTETRVLPLASGSSLRVKNVNGFIRVEAWDREEVQFMGEFKPSSKDEQVKVVVETGQGTLEIRGEYPKHTGWGSYSGPQCKMTLKVPRRVAPSLETVNGDISLSGTQGKATLNTVNGGIRAAQLAESLKAETVNGSITLEQSKGSLDLQTVNGAIKGSGLDGQGQGIKAQTVNGSIQLQLGGLKGRFRATTVNGGISFNAKGAEQVDVKKHRVTAVFPGSDQAIEIETVNGAITLD